jgi:hypothetical protein
MHDSDCEAGINGRCPLGIAGPPDYACSYDDCIRDSDCEAGSLCVCRPSSTSLYANNCMSGANCRVDSDCGPGGYCSPSALACSCTCGDSGPTCAYGDPCGHGYFCHTPGDACINDGDCPTGTICNYDRLEQRWDCARCVPPFPHP